jgi:hypothetical protein
VNGKHEIHFALKNAVEALSTTTGSDYERLARALSEVHVLKASDFDDPAEKTMIGIIKRAEARVGLGDKQSVDVRSVMMNIWHLYERRAPKLSS